MGWTGIEFNGGSVKDFLINQMSSEDNDFKWSFTNVFMRGTVAYGIFLRQDKHTGITMGEGMVILTRKEKGWLYTKELGETSYPYYFDAPKKLLDKLSLYPCLNDNATKWRETCRKNIERSKVKLKNGDVVRFASPLNFGNFKQDTFYYSDVSGRRTVFKTPEGIVVRIPKWKNREHTVISN